MVGPLERFIFRFSGIDSAKGMSWQQHLRALLTINLVWFFWTMLLLMNQGWLPWNPDGNPSMGPELAFNTTISFLVNCNLQHYSGETGATYLSQVFGMMFLQFVSAATGMAAAAMVFNALRPHPKPLSHGEGLTKNSALFSREGCSEGHSSPLPGRGAGGEGLGNFYDYFVKSLTRILIPLSVVVAVLLMFEGTPQTALGQDSIITLEGDSVQVSRGPVAGFVAIKHLGTNGGGFFGANSAHPLENPTYFSNMVEMWSQMVIPVAMVFALGYYLRKRRFALMVFGVMTTGFLLLAIPYIAMEMNGNPAIGALGVDQSTGSMEGKEVRFGAAATGYWSIVTTVISTGSVNSMHDSTMPLSGMNELLAKLLRVLETGDYLRVGDTKPRKADVRFIAATHRDLKADTGAGRFRQDLYYRLSTFVVRIPALVERRADIPLLAQAFLLKAVRKLQKPITGMDENASALLMAYHWPGQVRELRNVIDRACILCEGAMLDAAALPLELQGTATSASPGTVYDLEQVEREHIRRVLEHTGGNKTLTATLLGIGLTTLYAKLKKWEL
ncbi:MAG: potassium-transporting ATPase subunit KdpA [Flavobacteriales bacterium]|nr:potassium-transporting ATPase subunit KdpA [Flavobacteriales bacterium]